MRMSPPAVDPRLNPKIDGNRLSVGAWVFKDGRPITIVADNGVWFDYVEGHQTTYTSNNRSGLTF